MNTKPLAIIVEDFPAHMELMRALFQLYGCSVQGAPSLLQGMEQIYSYLRPLRSYTPTLAVIDINLPRESFDLQGTTLIAQMSEDIERGLLMPAWIIGISQEMSVERRAELRLAGAHHTFAKPLTPDTVQMLVEAAVQPPDIPAPDMGDDIAVARQSIRNASRQTLQVLQVLARPHEQPPVLRWSPIDVRALLFRPHLLSFDHRRFVKSIGGIHAVRAQFQQLDLSNRSELNHLRADILNTDGQIWDWQRYIAENNISQTTYYRYLNSIIALFMDYLNAETSS